MKIYYEQDVNAALIKAKKIMMIGYGSQGRAHALNLRDAGVNNITIALKKTSLTQKKALSDGFTVVSIEEADFSSFDLIMFAAPDELQADIYKNYVAKGLRSGMALAFMHGFNIHFGLIEPCENIDIIMISPKGPGHILRREYEKGAGLACLIAVAQNYTGQAKDLALSYACAIGGGRAGLLETSFKEECEADLFGEQAVLCGGLVHLLRAGYETLVEAGYSKEIAYFECVHEVKLIVDLIYESGIAQMNYAISNTAEWGEYVSGPRIINEETKKEMKRILEDIQTGRFSSKWMQEYHSGATCFKTKRQEGANHPMEEVGEKIRSMMPWIAANAAIKN